jgi:hypothetical protein
MNKKICEREKVKEGIIWLSNMQWLVLYLNKAIVLELLLMVSSFVWLLFFNFSKWLEFDDNSIHVFLLSTHVSYIYLLEDEQRFKFGWADTCISYYHICII